MREVKTARGWTLKVMEKWETLNPNWRPRKWISLVNAELKEKWYSPATKAEIEENYMSLLQLEEDQLKEMATDKTKPMLIRILIKNMLWWKGFDIIEKMLDRWIGKSKQTSEVELNVMKEASIEDFEI